MEKKDRMSFN